MVNITVVQTGSTFTATVLSTTPFLLKTIIGDEEKIREVSEAAERFNDEQISFEGFKACLQTENERKAEQDIVQAKKDLEVLSTGAKTLSNLVHWIEERDGKAYKVGTNVSLPDVLVAAMVEEAKYNAGRYLDSYKMFWDNCLLNPNPEARKDLFKWCTDNGLRITSQGNVIAYRGAILVKDTDMENYDEVLRAFNKLSARGKDPFKYCTVTRYSYDYQDNWEDELDRLVQGGIEEDDLVSDNVSIVTMEIDMYEAGLQEEPEGHFYFDVMRVHNIGEAYGRLSTSSDTVRRYTDAHTHTKDYRLGQTAREDRNKCDHNPANSCSYGLMCSPFMQ